MLALWLRGSNSFYRRLS